MRKRIIYALAIAGTFLSVSCAHSRLPWREVKGHTNLIVDVAFSPDGALLASTGWDGTVRLWETATMRESARLAGDGGHLYSVHFSADGRRLAAGGFNATVFIWDVATCKEIARFRKDEMGRVDAVALSDNGQYVAAASLNERFVVWDVDDRKEMAQIYAGCGPLKAAEFSRDGQRLLVAGWDNVAEVWDWRHGQRVQEVLFRGSEPGMRRAYYERPMINYASLSGHGGLMFAGTDYGSAWLYDMHAKQVVKTWPKDPVRYRGMQFVGGSDHIIYVRSGGLFLWDGRNDLQLTAKLPCDEYLNRGTKMHRLAVTADGRMAAICTSDTIYVLQGWSGDDP